MEEVMPARRHSSAMLSSPRKPSSTRRIFSSAEKWRRVARRMSLTTVSAGAFAGPEVCFIFAPYGYNEPDILRSGKPQLCLTGPDAGQQRARLPLQILRALLRPLSTSDAGLRGGRHRAPRALDGADARRIKRACR